MDWTIDGSYFDGSVWQTPVRIAPDSQFIEIIDCSPGMTTDNSGQPWVAWYHGSHPVENVFGWGIYTTVFDGTNWSVPSLAESIIGSDVKMATGSSGDLFLLWSEDAVCSDGLWGCSSVYLARFDGLNWSLPYPVALTSGTGGLDVSFYSSSIAADDSGGVWIAYVRYSDFDPDSLSIAAVVDYFRSDSLKPGGTKNLKNTALIAPCVAMDSNQRAWLVWVGNQNGNPDIYFSYWSGAGWSADEALTTDTSWDYQPSVMCDDSGRTWIAWTSKRNGNPNIFVARYDGVKWAQERITADPADSESDPCLMADSTGRVWCFWERDVSGNSDIFASYFYGDIGIESEKDYHAQPGVSLAVFPNPFLDVASVTCSSLESGPMNVVVCDVAGRVVQKIRGRTIGDGLAPGIYFLKAHGCITRKVIKLG
jgi:hypothetical protein